MQYSKKEQLRFIIDSFMKTSSNTNKLEAIEIIKKEFGNIINCVVEQYCTVCDCGAAEYLILSKSLTRYAGHIDTEVFHLLIEHDLIDLETCKILLFGMLKSMPFDSGFTKDSSYNTKFIETLSLMINHMKTLTDESLDYIQLYEQCSITGIIENKFTSNIMTQLYCATQHMSFESEFAQDLIIFLLENGCSFDSMIGWESKYEETDKKVSLVSYAIENCWMRVLDFIEKEYSILKIVPDYHIHLDRFTETIDYWKKDKSNGKPLYDLYHSDADEKYIELEKYLVQCATK